MSRLDCEEAGAALAVKLRALKMREAALGLGRGLELGVPAAEVAPALALGAQLRAYRFTQYRTGEGEDEERVDWSACGCSRAARAALTGRGAIAGRGGATGPAIWSPSPPTS